MADEIDAPLGKKKGNKKYNEKEAKKTNNIARKGWRSLVQFRSGKLPLTRILFGLLFALIALIIAVIVLVDNPKGGRPSADVSILNAPIQNNQIAIDTSMSSAPNDIATDNNVAKNIADNAAEITNSGTSISIITIDDNIASGDFVTSAGLATLNEFGVYPDLVEETPNGPIPRIGANGKTAFISYARPSITPEAANDKTLIAIVVTGLGLNETGTLDAIEKLPDAVTLAFAPYGRSLKRTTMAARNGGHEILLSLPLEPFDYPQNDPGPQTLLSDQPPRANLDRLFWLMGRFGGYIGVINHMGAKFTASAADFSPIMEELALRGLGYIDDGSSKRSLAANIAGNNRVAFGLGSVQIDINPSREAILARLAELEKKAQENNGAIGIASALPISIKTITEWANSLENKNIILVPASAIMSRP